MRERELGFERKTQFSERTPQVDERNVGFVGSRDRVSRRYRERAREKS